MLLKRTQMTCLTNCVAVWASNDENGLKNWYFVFPNIMIYANGCWYKGLVVQLLNGVEMEWDGWILRHCTLKTEQKGVMPMRKVSLHRRKWKIVQN
jgi:hypothetical protein